MKKIIALVLAMACVLGLMAGCVSPAAPTTNAPTTNFKPSQPTDPTTPSQPTDPTTPSQPTDPTTPSQPTDPTNPSDPTDPSEPSDPEVPTLPGAPVNGDKVHIFLPEKNLALGYNPDSAKPQRMEAVAGTVTDGALTAEGAGVFNVIVNKDGTYTFMCGGKYLTTGETGNSLSLEYDPSDYSIWTLEDAGNGNFYIKSNAVYGGNAQYLEYYSGFTTYKFQEAQALKECGGGLEIASTIAFEEKMDAFAADAALLEKAGKDAGDYVASNSGATARIFKALGL
jgi:hypothetical protein